MEMSNSHIKRREYEVAAGTGSDSTRHAGDVPSVSGEKEIIQLAAFEDHDADIPSNAGVINEHGIGMTAVDIEKDSQPAGLADNDPNIVLWDGNEPREPAELEAMKEIEQCLHRRRYLLRKVKPLPPPSLLSSGWKPTEVD